MIVNLNVLCKVQLNELGKVIWLSQVDSLPPEIKETRPDVIEAIKSAIDEKGCVEAPLWNIMSVFGRYMSPTTTPFVTSTIQLDKNPAFKKIVD